jgi:hypothetical protein
MDPRGHRRRDDRARYRFLITLDPIESSTLALCLLIVAAIVLDSGMTVNFILGQRSIFVTEAEFGAVQTGITSRYFSLPALQAPGSAPGLTRQVAGDECRGSESDCLSRVSCALAEPHRLHGGGEGGSREPDKPQ